MSLRSLAVRKHALLARSARLRGGIASGLQPAVRTLRIADRIAAIVRTAARLAPI